MCAHCPYKSLTRCAAKCDLPHEYLGSMCAHLKSAMGHRVQAIQPPARGVWRGVLPPLKGGCKGGVKGGVTPQKRGVCAAYSPPFYPLFAASAPRATVRHAPKPPTPTRAKATHQSRPHHPNGESISAPKPHPSPTLCRAAIHPYAKTPPKRPYKPPKSPAERPQPAPKHPPRADHPSPAQAQPCARYACAGCDPRRWHNAHSLCAKPVYLSEKC